MNFQDLLPIGVSMVVLGLVLAFGLQITGDIRTDMTANSSEYNATTDTMTAVGKITSKLGTIVTVLVAAVIIGVLIKAFVFNR